MASIQCASRIVYAMSRDDWGSMRIAYVHAEGTLMAAMLLSRVVALALLLTASFGRVLAVTHSFICRNTCCRMWPCSRSVIANHPRRGRTECSVIRGRPAVAVAVSRISRRRSGDG